MAQKGRIYRVGSCWLLRYWETVVQDGVTKKRRATKKLASYPDYRTKKDVEPLAAAILGPINAKTAHPESTSTLHDFLLAYLAHGEGTWRPSSVKTYRGCFKLLEPHLGDLRLRDVRVPHIARLLQNVANTKKRAHTSYKVIKGFLVGAFKYARVLGVFDSDPVRDAPLPRGLAARPMHAYTPEEVKAMLAVLPPLPAAVVTVAAFTGLRVGEIKGLKWDDIDFDKRILRVERGIWNGRENDVKTLQSKAAVPMVAPVVDALTAHRKRTTGTGYVFTGSTGRPLWLEHLVERIMLPAFRAAGIEWHGWHAFRRGVATTLHGKGVADHTIQVILRHSNISTTLKHYIRPVAETSRAALENLVVFRTPNKKTKTA